jgi:VIT1/CCC1 family predicted Fe2+/Mn2+ transporter
MEDYAAKMAGKTDAELRVYVDNRAEYIEQAVLAALTELERRGHAVPDAPQLRQQLEAAARQAAATAVVPEAPPWARPAAEEEEEPEEEQGPALYSPGTIAVFSVLFSFFVGGFLLLLNFLRLRRYGGAALLLAVVIVVLSVQAWLPAYAGIRPEAVVFGVNVLAALLYVYVLWPNFIGAQPYQPRSWLMPLFIAFGLSLLMLALLRYSGVPVPPLGQ